MGILIHYSNKNTKNGKIINLVDDKRFGDEDRKYKENQNISWSCEQLNFHRFNITKEFLGNREQICKDKPEFGPPQNFKRNFN